MNISLDIKQVQNGFIVVLRKDNQNKEYIYSNYNLLRKGINDILAEIYDN